MKNKNLRKYDLFTIIIVVITLTILAIGALVLANFIGEFGSDLKDDANEMVSEGYLNQSNADYATNFIANDSGSFSDNYVFWFFIATFLGLILTAIYLEFEPSIMIILFIFGSIAILGAWLGSQIYGEFSTEVPVTAMGKTAIFMGNPYFPVFILVGLIVMMVIMYSKKRTGDYQ